MCGEFQVQVVKLNPGQQRAWDDESMTLCLSPDLDDFGRLAAVRGFAEEVCETLTYQALKAS